MCTSYVAHSIWPPITSPRYLYQAPDISIKELYPHTKSLTRRKKISDVWELLHGKQNTSVLLHLLRPAATDAKRWIRGLMNLGDRDAKDVSEERREDKKEGNAKGNAKGVLFHVTLIRTHADNNQVCVWGGCLYGVSCECVCALVWAQCKCM